MSAGRTGVVLAAGFGSRLGGDDDTAAVKPLTPVAGVPLLARALRGLTIAGCTRAAIVVGHRAGEIEAFVAASGHGDLAVEVIHNPRYELGNGVSVLAARASAGEPFVLVMADHLLGDQVMAIARETAPPAGGLTLLVDRRIDGVFDLDDATKVRTGAGGRIAAIGKALGDYDAIDTGVFVATQGLCDELERILADCGDASLSDGVAALAGRGLAATADIGDGFWQDVDTPEMLAHAEAELRWRQASRGEGGVEDG